MTADLSYIATRTLNLLSTKRARKLETAIDRAGGNRYSVSIPRELYRAGVIKDCGRGYVVRVG